ncbi:hypothetical protein [Pontibacter flavimaris]|nr:hypothetical protein [Pontibacter flavimaris]
MLEKIKNYKINPPLLVIAAALVVVFYAGLMVGESIGELIYNVTH